MHDFLKKTIHVQENRRETTEQVHMNKSNIFSCSVPLKRRQFYYAKPQRFCDFAHFLDDWDYNKNNRFRCGNERQQLSKKKGCFTPHANWIGLLYTDKH